MPWTWMSPGCVRVDAQGERREGKGRKHVGRDESRDIGRKGEGISKRVQVGEGHLRTSLFTWSRYASRRKVDGARANDRTRTLLCTWSGVPRRLIGKIHEEDRGIVCSRDQREREGESRVKHARKWHDRAALKPRIEALDSEMRGFRADKRTGAQGASSRYLGR